MNVTQLNAKLLDPSLKKLLIEHTLHLESQATTYDSQYGPQTVTDKDSPFYFESYDKWVEQYGPSGAVSFYRIPEDIDNQITEFYKDDPIIDRYRFRLIQVVKGGKYVVPHVDDSRARTKGTMYLLQAGNNIQTSWYKIKDEYSSLPIPEAKIIPYSSIELIETHTLLQDTWYATSHDVVHSVEGLDNQLRIALVAAEYRLIYD